MSNIETRPYLLDNGIQHYPWGTKNKDAFIPKFLRKEIEPDKHYAELWIGAHPKLPSSIVTSEGRISLNSFIRKSPIEILGEKAAKSFGNKLPFLFKILSAGEALSIQAHPNKEQAEKLHKKDPVNYPDDNHKPEIAIALDSMTALVGFRPVEEIINVLKNNIEIAEFVGTNYLTPPGNEENSAKNWLQSFYSKLMNKAFTDEEALEYALVRLEDRLQLKKQKDEREQLFLDLKKEYGNDVGLLSIFMLNLLHLAKGEGVFLNAGVPHAYLKGNIVECMANSDNVVRAGLTPKFKDVRTLVDILTYESGRVEILGNEANSGDFVYKTPVPEFELKKYVLEKDTLRIEKTESLSVYLILEGTIKIKWDEKEVEYSAGSSIMIPAVMDEFIITAVDDSLLFKVYIP